MGAEAPIRPPTSELDDIRIYLGDIPDDLYALRAKLRTARNASAFRINTVESSDARVLLRLCCDSATAWVYADASPAELREQFQYCKRLLTVAEQAEKIFLGYGGE